MLSARVQQSPRLVDLAWLDHDFRLARLVGSVAHLVHKDCWACGSEEHDQDFIIIEMSSECYHLDVNLTADQF